MNCKLLFNTHWPWHWYLVGLALIVGCEQRNQPVRSEVALKTLQLTLDQWKQGNPIEASVQREPAIVVQDFAWKEGVVLQDYKIVGHTAKDANLFVTVELKFAGKSDSKHIVTYCVGTDPVLTVFRTMDEKESKP